MAASSSSPLLEPICVPRGTSPGVFVHSDKSYYLKSPPAERADGGLDISVCFREVLASHLFRYLLGEERSPHYRLAIDSDSQLLSVASEDLGAVEEFGEEIYGAALHPLLSQFAEVFAAGLFAR